MQIIEIIIPFVFLHLLIFLIPGPNLSIVIRNTLKYGFYKGIYTTLGIMCAITLHTQFALLASDILVTQFHAFFSYIKAIGALYLMILGVNLLINACKLPVLITTSHSSVTFPEPRETLSNKQAFQMGFLLDLFNPYIGLFYLSIFPFYLKKITLPLAFPLFGGLVAALNFIWFGGLSYLAAWTKNKLAYQISDQFLEFFTGLAMIGFGLFQLVSR